MLQAEMTGFFNGIIAFGTAANFAAIAALLYKVGRYVGTNDEKIMGIQKEILEVKNSLHDHFQYDSSIDSQIQATQVKHGESLARVETECSTMQRDILIIRDRQHAMTNSLNVLGLQAGLQKIPEAEGGLPNG